MICAGHLTSRDNCSGKPHWGRPTDLPCVGRPKSANSRDSGPMAPETLPRLGKASEDKASTWPLSFVTWHKQLPRNLQKRPGDHTLRGAQDEDGSNVENQPANGTFAIPNLYRFQRRHGEAACTLNTSKGSFTAQGSLKGRHL